LGSKVRSWVPRAGLLGSLAAIALALIAFVPLWRQIAAVPVVGMLAMTVILVTLIAKRALPGKVPGALAAVVLGAAAYYLAEVVSHLFACPVVPPLAHHDTALWQSPSLLPDFARNAAWWQHVVLQALASLPVMLPFALATIVGGIDCTESAAAVGDEYDTRSILLTEGLASVAAALCGGVIQNTPYIGHPAYKAMGGRAAYTLATAIFIGAAGVFGWFPHLFNWLPEVAAFPILVFVGLEITAQSFRATPERHLPAVALAILPALAYLMLLAVDQVASYPLTDGAAALVQPLRCLANGFIVTSLLWAAALASMMDGKLLRSAGYLGIAGVCSLFGIIHSPLQPAVIALPNWVFAQMPQELAIRCQSPFHWTVAYTLAAVLLVLLHFASGATDNEGNDMRGALDGRK
jgi:AGZA family xanthine/uracil permease-like MFS transporter